MCHDELFSYDILGQASGEVTCKVDWSRSNWFSWVWLQRSSLAHVVWFRRWVRDTEYYYWPLLFMMSSTSSSPRSTFLERPICPSLGARCPSLWGLGLSCPFCATGLCPGLNWPAGPGCRGPFDGIRSGIPDDPYISPIQKVARSISPLSPLGVLLFSLLTSRLGLLPQWLSTVFWDFW